MNYIEQMTEVYLKEEYWHKNKLTKAQADQYHERLLIQGNILTYIKGDQLLGYVEFWRLDFDQLGRLVCKDSIITDVEDILNGPIAYVNNMWISKGERHGEAFEILGSMFLSKNSDAEYFVAFRQVKKNQPIKVYSRRDIMKLYTKGI